MYDIMKIKMRKQKSVYMHYANVWETKKIILSLSSACQKFISLRYGVACMHTPQMPSWETFTFLSHLGIYSNYILLRNTYILRLRTSIMKCENSNPTAAVALWQSSSEKFTRYTNEFRMEILFKLNCFRHAITNTIHSIQNLIPISLWLSWAKKSHCCSLFSVINLSRAQNS